MSYERPIEDSPKRDFIGRAEELAFLDDKLQLAKNGKGQFVFVYGESGIGKTELVKKFLKDKDDCLAAKHECKQNSIDIVFNDLLTKLIIECHKKHPKKFKRIGLALGKTILDLGPDAIAAFKTPATTLLSLGVKGLKQMKKELDNSRESSIEKFTNFTPIYIEQLEILSQEEPLILFIDDIHDIDSASKEILGRLIDRQREKPYRIMVMGTYQDEILQTKDDKNLKDLFADAISHSRSTIDNDNSKCCAKYLIEGFNNDEYNEFIDRKYPHRDEDLLQRVREIITPAFNHNDKKIMPMFLIEILDYLEEEGKIVKDGVENWSINDVSDIKIPDNIESLIDIKVDRLSENEKKFIQLASHYGFEWYKGIIKTACEFGDDQTKTIIDNLIKKHNLIEYKGKDEYDEYNYEYGFRHHIIFKHIYQNVDEPDRDSYHKKIADAMQTVFGEKLKDFRYTLFAYEFYKQRLIYRGFIDNLISEKVTDKTPQTPEDNKLLLETVDNYTNIAGAFLSQHATEQTQAFMVKAGLLLEKVSEETENYDETKFDYLNITYRLLDWRGNYADALSIALEMEKIADILDDTEKKALVYNVIGYSNKHLGHLDDALDYYKKALDIATEMNDMVKVAVMSNNIGSTLESKGDFEKALEYYQKALEIDEGLKNWVNVAIRYNNIGSTLESKGNFEKALDYYQKALEIDEGLKNWVNVAIRYNNIGGVHQAKGDFEKALEYYKKALEIDEGLKNWVSVAIRYNNIGFVHQAKGDFDKALEYFKKALEIDEGLKNWVNVAIRYNNIGSTLESKGDFNKALEYYQKALDISTEMNDMVKVATMSNNIGSVHKAKGDFDQALEYYKKALDIATEKNDMVKVATMSNNIGGVYQAKSDFDKALEYYQKALDIDEGLKNWVAVATRYNNIGLVHKAKGDFDKALEYYQKALVIDAKLNNWYSVAGRCWNIGCMQIFNLNNQEEGMKYHMQAFQIWKQTGGNIPPQVKPQLPQNVIDFIEGES